MNDSTFIPIIVLLYILYAAYCFAARGVYFSYKNNGFNKKYFIKALLIPFYDWIKHIMVSFKNDENEPPKPDRFRSKKLPK